MAVTVAYQHASTYTGAQDRLTHVAAMAHTTNIAARSGVVPASGNPLNVSAAGGMNLTVSPGHAMVGDYTFTVDTNTNVTLATSGATARTDAVILRAYEQDSGDAAPSRGVVEVVTGTSIAAPSLPTRSFLLAYITVNASVSSVNSGNITDARVYTAAAGGVVHSPGSYTSFPSGLPASAPVWDPTTKRLLFAKSGGFDEPTVPSHTHAQFSNGLLLDSRPSSRDTTGTTPRTLSGPHSIALGSTPRRIQVSMLMEGSGNQAGLRIEVTGLPRTFRAQEPVQGTTGAGTVTPTRTEIFDGISGTLSLTFRAIRDGGSAEITMSNGFLQVLDLGVA